MGQEEKARFIEKNVKLVWIVCADHIRKTNEGRKQEIYTHTSINYKLGGRGRTTSSVINQKSLSFLTPFLWPSSIVNENFNKQIQFKLTLCLLGSNGKQEVIYKFNQGATWSRGLTVTRGGDLWQGETEYLILIAYTKQREPAFRQRQSRWHLLQIQVSLFFLLSYFPFF